MHALIGAAMTKLSGSPTTHLLRSFPITIVIEYVLVGEHSTLPGVQTVFVGLLATGDMES